MEMEMEGHRTAGHCQPWRSLLKPMETPRDVQTAGEGSSGDTSFGLGCQCQIDDEIEMGMIAFYCTTRCAPSGCMQVGLRVKRQASLHVWKYASVNFNCDE